MKVKDVAKPFATHRTAPKTKNDSDPKVNSFGWEALI
jgi:hypothetical protein